jgi:ABC-type phosphate transport system permease subunit
VKFERTDIVGGFFRVICIVACIIIIAMLTVILGNIVIHGIGAVTLDFLTKAPEAGMTGGGIFPAIFGTFALVVLMTVAVIPLGVATAIYMHEYAPKGPKSSIWYVLQFKTWLAFPRLFSVCSDWAFSLSLSVVALIKPFTEAGWYTVSRR